LKNNMAPGSPQTRNDDFDDDLDDILKDVLNPTNVVQSTEQPTQPEPWRSKKSDAAGIIITKKRQPAPKLDDQRLLSEPGVPRLRKISKDRLRFKGKGHEVRARHGLVHCIG
jgi:replication fork protection complex subunit Csm3/Swi3